jgi:tripartite ATP-independent transporter DctM subunit
MLVISIVLLLMVFLVIGMPVGFAIGCAGAIGLYAVGGMTMLLSILNTTPFSTAAHYELMTIPMFILMAEFIVVSGVADELFDTVNAWVASIRGGLGISTVITGAAFGAVCGSSAASAATLSSTAIPQMVKHGYEKKLASGLTAIVGTLAVMIPPSNGLVIYGIIGDVDLGKLLVAGFFPGILGALTLTIALRYLLWRNPARGGAMVASRVSIHEKMRLLKGIWPMLVLFILVTGVLYLGVATPTEAASMGAFGAFVLALVRRKLDAVRIYRALTRTARTSTMITMIIIGALIFGYFLTITETTQNIVGGIGALHSPRWVILALIICVYIVLGCFLDQVAILVLTVPITLPIITALHYDPVWFGIIVTLTSEIGLVTPPFGLNAFIVSKTTDTPVEQVFAGVTPFFLAMAVLLVILAAFPELVLWIPNSMPH